MTCLSVTCSQCGQRYVVVSDRCPTCNRLNAAPPAAPPAASGSGGTPYSIMDAWARSTTSRMRKGGDLYIEPMTREQMTAPLAWHERQLAVCRRYGVLADGSIGFEVVS